MSYTIENNKLTVIAPNGQTFVFNNTKNIKHGQFIIPFPQELLPENAIPIARFNDIFIQNYNKLEYIETDRAKDVLPLFQQHGGGAKKIVPQCNNVLRYAKSLNDSQKANKIKEIVSIVLNFVV